MPVAHASTPLETARVRIGPYSVLQEVARGGMGAVFRARGADGRHVAIKLLLPEQAGRPLARKRFVAEALALSRLQHPGVVPILGAGEHQGCPWLALEFVEGESLEQRLRRGPLSIEQTLEVARQLASALVYVHGCGLLHRDLKPDNVLLRGDQALLTDFGLVLDEQSELSRMTATGIFMGTPGYWSPEQARGRVAQFGPWTDVYGFGAVLYACLTARAPVEAETLVEAVQRACFGTPKSPRSVRREVPAWLSELCMHCLRADPQARPQSVTEVVDVLRRAGGKRAVPGSRRGLWAVLAALTVALICAVGGTVWASARDAARVDDLIASSRALSGERSYGAALELVEEACELDPENYDAFVLSAFYLERLGRVEEAFVEAERALELKPAGVRALVRKGSLYLTTDRPAEALVCFDAALELDPDHFNALAERSAAHMGLGNADACLADLTRAIELRPESGQAYVSRGSAYAIMGQEERALADYARAIELEPDFEPAYSMQASSLRALTRYEEAIESLDRALELEPSSAENLYSRGVLQAALGRLDKAISDYDGALALGHPHPPQVCAVRAPVLHALGNYSAALKDCDAVLEDDPVALASLVLRGRCKGRLARYKEAELDFDRALEIDPTNYEALAFRVQCHTNQGNLSAALADCESALKLELDANRRSYLLDRRTKILEALSKR